MPPNQSIETLHTDANLPWFKQFWPWFIMFFPATAVVAGLATIVIAISSDDGLVDDNYYQSGLAINQTMADEEHARTLGLSARLEIKADTRQVYLTLNGNQEISKQRLVLRLTHPTIKGRDITVPLQAQQDGIFHGYLDALPAKGRWYVTLVPENKNWRISNEVQLPIATDWKLEPR